jgi:alpha-mannosidase
LKGKEKEKMANKRYSTVLRVMTAWVMGILLCLVAVDSLLYGWQVSGKSQAQFSGGMQEIFRIGKQDRSFMEFAHHTVNAFGGPPLDIQPVDYQVGRSLPDKDWSAYQPGPFDAQVRSSTREHDWVEQKPNDGDSVPFHVKFTLANAPRGKFVLHLDAILRYTRPAAPRYVVEINGHLGSYQLIPRPAADLWWPTGSGNVQFVGYGSLDMPMPAAYFHQGSNTLALRCEDGFGIFYDDLALLNNPKETVPRVLAGSVNPTIFYKRRGKGLAELAEVRVRSSRPLGAGSFRIVVGSEDIKQGFNQTGFGDVTATAEVRAPETSLPVRLYVSGEHTPIFSGEFQPKRRWRVYALPTEQADFGFDEVPAMTLDWENRYIDKAMEIVRKYPSYSFTLDAAANLEAYLNTRDRASRELLLSYLRTGKFGVNALYEDFLTQLATPEELFQLLDYALKAGRQFGIKIDSASQTDEPTICWAAPQIFSDAGIKYYADGSDDFRAPFNPIGHWNFRSPFYWEAPNGARVLVWSGVAYVVLTNLTWGGWNPEAVRAGRDSPSLLGLKHSLPLFLSQYARKDYPFNAVLLYGLHNDEVPIRHFGNADVMELWNKTYAYPKLIAGTQRDYFGYVTQHFDSQIKTYRGSPGANWEEMAAQDARVLAKNRFSQMQILAAEKLGSVATWLVPVLHLGVAQFQQAWRSILLTDDFVMSDMTSVSRPYGYLTRYEEDVHRGNAAAAYRQTRDLLRVAMDQLSGLIRTRQPGSVVFNTGSQPRDGFFNFELGSDEALLDPVTNQLLPCGILRAYQGYVEVRCWVKNVPALGYRFYRTVKGKVPAGEKVRLESPTSTIEGRYYRLQLDPKTGAVAHLIDKENGTDLVNARSGYALNEYLYVTGGDSSVFYHGSADAGSTTDNRLLASDPTLPLPDLTIHRSSMVGAPQVLRFPWGTVITVRARAFNTPEITSTITLNDEAKLVTFRNKVEKKATLKKEGVYFAFPFGLLKPRVDYQEASAWVNPETDLLPGANQEWFCTQGGVQLTGNRQSVAWITTDAPLFTLENINRGLWTTSLRIHDGTVFSYVMNNYTLMDAPAQQGGHFTFRYVVTSGKAVPLLRTAKLSAAVRSPLCAIQHYYDKGWKPGLPESGQGFLDASPEGVELLTMRPVSQESHTYLLRVHNATNQAITARLQFPLVTLENAYLGTALGERRAAADWSRHEVIFPMKQYDIKTIVISVQPPKD